MSNELATTKQVGLIQNVDDLGRIGKMMAQSGYFTDARDVAQASVKVMAGMEMGFGAFASMNGIYIIQGKPSIGANLMASAVKASQKYDYRAPEVSDKSCKIEIYEKIDGKRELIGVSSFTIEEARKAGVKNLDKFPRNMLFARAMSNAIRWYCPDVFSGNAVYVPEELGANVDGEGNVISIEGNAPQTAAPVIEAQEPVIEGEIIEPINNTPEEENAVEAQESANTEGEYSDEDKEVLLNWKHRAGLPALNINHAMKMSTDKGLVFGEAHPSQLMFVMNAYQARLEKGVSDDVREATLLKMSAINEVLTMKAGKYQDSLQRPDPFVKGA